MSVPVLEVREKAAREERILKVLLQRSQELREAVQREGTSNGHHFQGPEPKVGSPRSTDERK